MWRRLRTTVLNHNVLLNKKKQMSQAPSLPLLSQTPKQLQQVHTSMNRCENKNKLRHQLTTSPSFTPSHFKPPTELPLQCAILSTIFTSGGISNISRTTWNVSKQWRSLDAIKRATPTPQPSFLNVWRISGRF